MNSKVKFALVIALMLAVVIAIEYRMPRRFEWIPTFAHGDGQPFGCMVFDSILSQSMPKGYVVVKKTLYQLERDGVLNEPHGIVVLSNESILPVDMSKMMTLAEEGHVVLLANSDNLYQWEDTLGINVSWNNYFDIHKLVGKAPEKRPVKWVADGNVVCRVYDQMVNCCMTVADSVPHRVLATYKNVETVWGEEVEQEWSAIAVSFPRGKGELIIVSAPLLLTNYAMLNHDGGAKLIEGLMGCMSHLPVIRTEGYMRATAFAEESPFYVFLKQPPLRWALYLTIITVVLFCIFTARRRQRPVPVVPPRKNGNLEFVRLIGTLYWQEKDHAGLLAKKWIYTTEEIRRQTGLDVASDGTTSDMEPITQLAYLIGREPQELVFVIRQVKEAANRSHVMTEPELKTLVAELDKIIASL